MEGKEAGKLMEFWRKRSVSKHDLEKAESTTYLEDPKIQILKTFEIPFKKPQTPTGFGSVFSGPVDRLSRRRPWGALKKRSRSCEGSCRAWALEKGSSKIRVVGWALTAIVARCGALRATRPQGI